MRLFPVMNPNTVVRAYRELEHEGVIAVKHGSGAFVKEPPVGRAGVMRQAQAVVQSAIQRLRPLGLTEDELRRVFENEIAQIREKVSSSKPTGSVSLSMANRSCAA